MRCTNCMDNPSKISIALCKKLFGTKTKKILCMNCLANHLDLTVNELMEMAEDFKNEGCQLFE